MIPNILKTIIANKRQEVDRQKSLLSIDKIIKQLEQKQLRHNSLKTALECSDSGIISEFKRKSPSQGWINQQADIQSTVVSYEAGGASAVSVLTDHQFFGGSLLDLQQASQRLSIPILRKDFVIDEYQLYEAKLNGADAVLLIASALTPQEAKYFTCVAKSLNLDVLLELHNESEIGYISSDNAIVGVNNRNLTTFITDIDTSFRLIERLPKDVVLVSESGISSSQIIRELRSVGYRGFLIGEGFMKHDNPGENLRDLINQLTDK